MSIDEGELHASLSTALDDLDCGPLPLNSVISQGKTVVLRRRLTAAAGALAVAVAAVAGPVIARQIGRPAQPTTSAPYHLTVHPPGDKSPTGLIAYGRLGRNRWLITGTASQTAGRMNICFQDLSIVCHFLPIPAATDKGQPVDFDMTVGEVPMELIGDVRSDVRFVKVSLSNGQTVMLRPVAIFGHRHAAWIGLKVPYPAAVTTITAYSAHGVVGYAVPFGRGSLFSNVRWFAPGQRAWPKRATYKIASGEVKGKPWSEYAYVGPWGTCITGAGMGGECVAGGLNQLGDGKAASLLISSLGPPDALYGVIVARPAVSYVIVHFKNAAPVRLPTVAKGGVKFAGFVSVPPYAATRWVAYSASGQELASGGLS